MIQTFIRRLFQPHEKKISISPPGIWTESAATV